MNITDPYCFYPGDFTLFYAATLELMTRKLLHDHGFDQRRFTAHFDTEALRESGYGYYVSENLQPALQFVQEAVRFTGFRVIYRRKTQDDCFTAFAVKVPGLKKFSADELSKIEKQLKSGYFYPGYEVGIKGNTIFLRVCDDTAWDWRCLVNFVAGAIKLREELKSDGGNDYFKAGRVSVSAVS